MVNIENRYSIGVTFCHAVVLDRFSSFDSPQMNLQQVVILLTEFYIFDINQRIQLLFFLEVSISMVHEKETVYLFSNIAFGYQFYPVEHDVCVLVLSDKCLLLYIMCENLAK